MTSLVLLGSGVFGGAILSFSDSFFTGVEQATGSSILGTFGALRVAFGVTVAFAVVIVV